MSPPSTPSAGPKRYGQYCPVARSLDVVGERWTLLVVRSLLMGPQRYTDLRDALPGIATDLLTARLRTLEDAGYVRRRELPRPAPATVYELTESGWRLGPVVLALAQLGLERLGTPGADDEIDAATLVLSLRASFHPDPGEVGASYQLELDGEPFTVAIEDGWVQTRRGEAADPRCTISTTVHTFAALLSGAVDPKAAIASGDLELTGPQSCLAQFTRSFAFPATTFDPGSAVR
jgi:DNA-binding HxlR family transcriptional regulator/putative sterol carrier protein